MIDTKLAHVTETGGNVFLDLGFSPEEAFDLKADLQRQIAEKEAIKKKLMEEIAVWMDEKNLKQEEAAQILGVSRPRISDVVNQKMPKFTIDALISMLTRAGKHVEFSVA